MQRELGQSGVLISADSTALSVGRRARVFVCLSMHSCCKSVDSHATTVSELKLRCGCCCTYLRALAKGDRIHERLEGAAAAGATAACMHSDSSVLQPVNAQARMRA